MDSFRFGFENDWEFDSGMDKGGRAKFTSGGGCEIGWRAGSGGDVDGSVDGELDGRSGDGGELGEEDGVRSGGELDVGEFSEDGVRDGGDLDGSGGAKSGGVDLNSGSALQRA